MLRWPRPRLGGRRRRHSHLLLLLLHLVLQELQLHQETQKNNVSGQEVGVVMTMMMAAG